MNESIKLFNEGKFDLAYEFFADYIKLNPNDTSAIKYMAKTLCSLKRSDEALNYFKRLFELEKTPENEGELGVCYYLIKDYINAQIHLINSIIEKYDENFAKTLEKVLLVHHNDEAMLGLKLLMHEAHPKDIYILRDITNYAQKLKNFDAAIQYFDILLKLCPDDYVAWNNLGLIYEEINEWEKADECYKKSLHLKDFFSPNFNLGILSRKLHRFSESIKYLKKAVIQNPNSPQPKYSLAMSYLMQKDFKNGYPLYAKHMTKIMPDFYKNEWDGTPHPDKSLCIFATGGLGDMIMFSRYFEYLKGKFKKIYILLPENLRKLFERNFPYIEIINSDIFFTNFDYTITPMHIAELFKLDFNEIVPYADKFLEDDKQLTEKFRKEFFNHDKLKIGINWHGNREGTRTFFNRSCPIENFEPVFNQLANRSVFYSIQKDESHVECQKYPFITDLYDNIKDFNDTASIIKNLDFLISIDSSPVHMAGALGVKTYVILPYANEWRWFIDDKKSIWYNSVELFRQDKEGDWNSAIEKIVNRLKMGQQ